MTTASVSPLAREMGLPSPMVCCVLRADYAPDISHRYGLNCVQYGRLCNLFVCRTPTCLSIFTFVAAQLASRDASITALQGAKADATLLASYATNAALSASETALQSALDAVLAQLAALQLSGGGVVNAPAWAGFTTWELLRGSNVVRNLHFMAPLSAALANGDDTLSIIGAQLPAPARCCPALRPALR